MKLNFRLAVSGVDSSSAVVDTENDSYYIEFFINALSNSKDKSICQYVAGKKKYTGSVIGISEIDGNLEDYSKLEYKLKIYIPRLFMIEGIETLLFSADTKMFGNKIFQIPSNRHVGEIMEEVKSLVNDKMPEVKVSIEEKLDIPLESIDYERIKMLVCSKF